MKEAIRVINVIISDLPDRVEEDDLEFVVDTSGLEIVASLRDEDGVWKPIPKEQINADVEDVYLGSGM